MQPFIRNIKTQILANDWSTLKKLTYEFLNPRGVWEKQVREVYDRGDGATILLYNTQKNSVILTRQFRIPTYLNGNPTGQMIETCAGKLDQATPEETIRKEVREETGYEVKEIKKVFELYMSPGSDTELIHFYTSSYDESMKITSGGGLESEQENIEVLELSYPEVITLCQNGEIRDGKTMLLLQYAELHNLLKRA